MRILIIYRHYWPDTTPYARLLKSIAERLAAEGHVITVFTAQPSYNDTRQNRLPSSEIVGGVRILRMPLLWERKRYVASRLMNSALYLAGAMGYGLISRRPDLVMTHSTPPAVMGFTGCLLSALRRAGLLYHCQDLNPEAWLYAGMVSNGALFRVLMAMEKVAHQRADTVVVLSEDMARTVRMRGLRGANIEVMNNFVLEQVSSIAELSPEFDRAFNPMNDVYRVLFAGNHGLFQGLEHVVEAAQILASNPQIQFHFVGEGLAKRALIQQAGDLVGRTVFFHPYVPVEVAFEIMRRVDLGLVTLQENIYKVAFPSKTMMLLTAGLPLLVAVEPESELSHYVRSEELGYTCPPNDAAALAAAVQADAAASLDRIARRERIRAHAEAKFGLKPNLDRWTRLLERIEMRRAR